MFVAEFKNHPVTSRRSRLAVSGFTLIEILVVVIILGIASAIIVPQISARSDMEVAAASRVIMADLLYAQNRAIATQQYQYVVFSTTNQSYTLYSGTSTGPTTILTHPVNLNNYVMTFGGSGTNSLGNVTLTSANFGSSMPTIAFDSLGTPYYFNAGTSTNTLISGTGTIVVTSGGYSQTISVEQNTGDITVQ